MGRADYESRPVCYTFLFLRDGPLEKCWGGGGGGRGRELLLARIFPTLSGLQELFNISWYSLFSIYRVRDLFQVYFSFVFPHLPHHFSNGSLFLALGRVSRYVNRYRSANYN